MRGMGGEVEDKPCFAECREIEYVLSILYLSLYHTFFLLAESFYLPSTGLLIPQGQVSRIFDASYRSSENQYEGSGVGDGWTVSWIYQRMLNRRPGSQRVGKDRIGTVGEAKGEGLECFRPDPNPSSPMFQSLFPMLT